MRLTVIRNRPKRTISASGGLEMLQILLELETKRCANEDVGPPWGWIVRSHIGWRGKQNIPYKGVKISP